MVNHYGAALRVTGQYYVLLNDGKKAEAYFVKSIDHSKKYDRKFELARGYYEYAVFLEAAGQWDKARSCAQKAYDIFQQINAGEYIKRTAKFLQIKSEQPQDMQARASRGVLEKLGLSSVKDLSSYLGSEENLDKLLDKIMDAAMELSGAELGCLMLYPENAAAASPEIKVSRNMDKDAFDSQDFSISRSVIKKVEDSREPLLINDAALEEDLGSQMSVVVNKLRSILCLPLMSKKKRLGILYLENRLVGGVFNDEKLEMLRPLMIQAAISIENNSLHSRMGRRRKAREKFSADTVKQQDRTGVQDQFLALYNLTAREKEIVLMLLEGSDNSTVTAALGVKLNTLKTHVRNIYTKVGVYNRRELLRLFLDFVEGRI